MLGILLFSMVAVAGMTLVMDDEEDEAEGAPPGEGPEGETFNILSNLEEITGTVGNDEFNVDTGEADIDADVDVDQVRFDGEQLWIDWYSRDEGHLAEINGGAGNDSFSIQSGSVILTTGEGADVVDATRMEGGIINAGEGDLIRGSDVAKPIQTGISVEGAATVDGGSSAELIVATGNGAMIDAGEGDDQLLSVAGGAQLTGGEGDDFIDANAIPLEYSGHWDEEGRADGFVDVVDGGAGNDRIEDVDNGDIVTLGAGRDIVTAIYDGDFGELGPITFTDFNPAEDRLFIDLENLVPDATFPSLPDYEAYLDTPEVWTGPLAALLETVEAEGESHIFVDNTLVATLENTSGLIPELTVTFDRYGEFNGIRLRFEAV